MIRRRVAAWAGAALLAGSLVLAAPAGLRNEHDTGRIADAAVHVPVVDGFPAIGPDGRRDAAFAAVVRRLVPPGDHVRVVMPDGAGNGVCGATPTRARYWWFVYQIVPRASVCAPGAGWTAYVGVPAGDVRGREVVRVDDRHTLVRR